MAIDLSELLANRDNSESVETTTTVREDTTFSPPDVVAVITSSPQEDVEAEQAVGIPFKEEAARKESISVDPLTRDDFSTLDVDSLQGAFQDRQAKEAELAKAHTATIEGFLAAKSPEMKAYETRVMRRILMAEEEYIRAIAEVNGSTVNDVAKFLDRYVLRYMVMIGVYEDLVSRRQERESRDVTEQVLTDMSDDEWKALVRAKIDSRRSEGVLLSDNLFSIEEQARALKQFGGPEASAEANFNQFFAAIEAATSPLLVGAATKAGRFTKILSSPSRHIAATIGNVKGPISGTQALRNLMSSTTTPVDDNTLSLLSQKVFKPDSIAPMSVIDQSVPVQRMVNSQLLRSMEDLNMRGILGRAVNPELIPAIARHQADQFLFKYGLEGLDIDLIRMDNLDNYVWRIEMGKIKGGLYRSERSARKRLEVLGVPGKIEQTEDGFKIVIEKNVNLSGYTEGYDILLEQKDFLGNIFFSASTREQKLLSSMAAQAEYGGSVMKEIFEPYSAALRQLSRKESAVMNDFFRLYRDGHRAVLRDAPDYSEFATYYHAHFKKAPTAAVQAAYEASVDIHDAAWKLSADRTLKRALNIGFEHATDLNGTSALLRPVKPDELKGSDIIYDVVSGRDLSPADVTGPVYRLNLMYEGTVFISNPRNTRAIVHSDVLPYRFGGPRTNPDHGWYLVEESTVTLKNGDKIPHHPMTILGARTEKEVRAAFSQIRSILDADALFRKGLMSQSQLEDIIVTNNRFNPMIETIDEFWAWADDVGLKGGNLTTKARNATLDVGDPDFNLNTGARTAATVEDEGSLFSVAKKDQPVFTYGAEDTYNADPLDLISEQFSGEAYFLSNRQYLQQAMEGWVRTAKDSADVTLPNKNSQDYIKNFFDAEITNPNTDVGRRLLAARQRILRRLNAPTWASDMWDSMIENSLSYLYDKGFAGIAKPLRWSRTSAKDPANYLLSAGFYTKFGFFNWDQLILQSTQMAAISAISPVHGLKAASMATLLRLAVTSPDNIAKTVSKRLAKTVGVSEADIDNILRLVTESGRLGVSDELIERGGNQRITPGSLISRMLDRSTFFFKEGERNSRVTSIATAYLEYKNKFPEAELFSDHMRSWIARREHELTFHMTGVGKNALQANTIMKVATQWTSYTLRSMEAVFFNRSLSAAERLRLGVYLMPMWGMTGLGIGGSAVWIADQLGLDLRTDEGKQAYTFIKYGVFDGLLNYAGVDNTATAARFAPLGGISQLIYDWSSQPVTDTLLGPSGGIVYDMTVPFMQMIGNVMHGRIDAASYDLERLARNISTVDKLHIAALAYRNDLYRAKTGSVAPTSLGTQELVTNVILGFPIREVQEFYSAKSALYWKRQSVEKLGKEIQLYVDRGFDLYARGERDAAYQIFEEAAEMVSLLEPAEKREIVKRYWGKRDVNILELVRDLHSKGLYREAEALLGQSSEYVKRQMGRD